MPVGIDPGFGHNVGLLDPVDDARAMFAGKVSASPPPLAAIAKTPELLDWVADGHGERRGLVRAAGGVEAPDFPERFRARLRERLRDERGAGRVEAFLDVTDGTGASAERVRQVSRLFPESWVRAGNAIPLRAMPDRKRGSYRRPKDDDPAHIVLDPDVDTPLHEYLHHLQAAMPGLDEKFQRLHRHRTAGEPRVQVGLEPRETGRKDQYIDPYFGREYGGLPGEVMTMAIHVLFSPVLEVELLRDLVRDDPELLDLALGVLFHYDP